MSKPTKERIDGWFETARSDAALLNKPEYLWPEGVSRYDLEGTFRVNLTCLAWNGHEAEAREIAATVPGFELGRIPPKP